MIRGVTSFTESGIWETFDKIGRVKDVRRIKDRLTGDYKDFCFVEFETEAEADFVIDLSQNNPIRINGRPVMVSKSKSKKPEIGQEFEKKLSETHEKQKNTLLSTLKKEKNPDENLESLVYKETGYL